MRRCCHLRTRAVVDARLPVLLLYGLSSSGPETCGWDDLLSGWPVGVHRRAVPGLCASASSLMPSCHLWQRLSSCFHQLPSRSVGSLSLSSVVGRVVRRWRLVPFMMHSPSCLVCHGLSRSACFLLPLPGFGQYSFEEPGWCRWSSSDSVLLFLTFFVEMMVAPEDRLQLIGRRRGSLRLPAAASLKM